MAEKNENVSHHSLDGGVRMENCERALNSVSNNFKIFFNSPGIA